MDGRRMPGAPHVTLFMVSVPRRLLLLLLLLPPPPPFAYLLPGTKRGVRWAASERQQQQKRRPSMAKVSIYAGVAACKIMHLLITVSLPLETSELCDEDLASPIV